MERYDIDQCAGRAKTAIEQMRATVRPGAQTGRGGKAAVLRAVREQLRDALRDRYTVRQLTDALREVFGGELNPKTVRAAMRDDAAPGEGVAKRRRRRKTTGTAAAPALATAAPTAASASSTQAAPVGTPVQAQSGGPEATDTGGVQVPSAGFTPGQRAQYQIPAWADGSDLRPGEELAAYARRKRVAGRPRTPDELRKFIGEGDR